MLIDIHCSVLIHLLTMYLHLRMLPVDRIVANRCRMFVVQLDCLYLESMQM